MTAPPSESFPGPGFAVPGIDPEPSSIGTTAETLSDGSVRVVGGITGPCGPRSTFLGGIATSETEVAHHLPGRVDVVARGTDGAIWHAGATADGVIGWESLGGEIVGAPSIAAGNQSAQLYVVARQPDGSLTTRLWNHTAGARWDADRDFIRVPGVWSSDPDVAHVRASRIDVVGLGTDGNVCHAFVADTGQLSFGECFPGGFTSAPTIALEPLNSNLAQGVQRAWIFVRGLDNALWVNRFENLVGWSGWYLVGGVLTSAPDAAFIPGLGVRVAMRGTDGNTWYTEGDVTFAPFTKALPIAP